MNTIAVPMQQTPNDQPVTRTSIGRLVVTGTVMTVVLTILVGVIYPFVMSGLAQVFFNN
jgi:hypothetical protein